MRPTVRLAFPFALPPRLANYDGRFGLLWKLIPSFFSMSEI